VPYHVQITQKSYRQHDEVRLDLTKEQLETRFLIPYREGRSIVIGGKTIPPEDIERIRINYTDQTSEELLPIVRREEEEERRSSRVVMLGGPSDEWHVASRGRDVTDDFITGPAGTGAIPRSQATVPSTQSPRAVFKKRKEETKTSPPVIPLEITESLRHFREDHPESDKVAFIMMKFKDTSAHRRILKTIRNTLSTYQLEGVRSDDHQYHDDLFQNVETYIHGCKFGVAVFDSIGEKKFSPNVSLEVGYTMALGKDVCLLKDKSLATLPADLLGKLYKIFDPQNPEKTIRKGLSKWLRDKGLDFAKKSTRLFRWRTETTLPITLSQIRKSDSYSQRIPSGPADPDQIGVDVLFPRSMMRKYGGDRLRFYHIKYKFEAGKHLIFFNFKKLAKQLIELGAKNKDKFRFEIRYPEFKG